MQIGVFLILLALTCIVYFGGGDANTFTNALAYLRVEADAPAGGVPRNILGLLVVLGVVVVAYAMRFARWVDSKHMPEGFPPESTLSFTTRLNYAMGWILYVGTGAAVVLICFFGPSLARTLICSADMAVPFLDLCLGPDLETAVIRGFPDTLLVPAQSVTALGLGLFLALALLGIPKLEESWRRTAHTVALIPNRAETLKDVLSSNFGRFRIEDGHDDAFLAHHNPQEPGYATTTLYKEEFAQNLRDEGFLEVYPRLEFYLWRIDTLSGKRRSRYGLSRFTGEKGEIAQIRETLVALRAAIARSERTVLRIYGEDFADVIAEVHREKGIDWAPGAPLGVTVLDNILDRIKRLDPARADHYQTALADYLLETVKDLAIRCRDLNERMIRIIVLLSLYGTNSPRKRLRWWGLQGNIDKLDTEIVPRFLLVLLVAALTVTGLIWFFAPHWPVNIVAMHAAAMPAAACIGAYCMAATRSHDHHDSENDATPVDPAPPSAQNRRAASDWQVLFLLLAGVMASFIAVSLLPTGSRAPGQISPAAVYTPAIAIYGAYIAYVFLRQEANLPLFRTSDVWIVAAGMAAAAAGFHVNQIGVPGGLNELWSDPDKLRSLGLITCCAGVVGVLFIGYARFIETDRKRVQVAALQPVV
jgi:hypothetical protein